MTNQETLQAIYRAFEQEGVIKLTPHPKVMDALTALIEREKKAAVEAYLDKVQDELESQAERTDETLTDAFYAMFPNAE